MRTANVDHAPRLSAARWRGLPATPRRATRDGGHHGWSPSRSPTGRRLGGTAAGRPDRQRRARPVGPATGRPTRGHPCPRTDPTDADDRDIASFSPATSATFPVPGPSRAAARRRATRPSPSSGADGRAAGASADVRAFVPATVVRVDGPKADVRAFVAAADVRTSRPAADVRASRPAADVRASAVVTDEARRRPDDGRLAGGPTTGRPGGRTHRPDTYRSRYDGETL